VKTFASELLPTVHLEWLLSQLNVNSCVATSGSPEKVRHSLHYTGLKNHFSDRVFTSSEVENGKPAPDLFLDAAANMPFHHRFLHNADI
jgi:beta-phosphoglucomutase-like phosphatase (HAD superfamily)